MSVFGVLSIFAATVFAGVFVGGVLSYILCGLKICPKCKRIGVLRHCPQDGTKKVKYWRD